jgi:hypothetical protein
MGLLLTWDFEPAAQKNSRSVQLRAVSQTSLLLAWEFELAAQMDSQPAQL